MFLAFCISRGWIFSKMERTFFFLVFCPPSIRAVRRGFGRLAGKNGGVQGEEIFARSQENSEKN